MVRAATSVPNAFPFSIRALCLSKAWVMRVVVIIDLVQVLDVYPSPMRAVVEVATQPKGKGVFVAGLDELHHACLLVSSRRLLVVKLLGMLTSYSRMELVVEEDGAQLVLVEVQKVPEVALELEEHGPGLVCDFLGDSILKVVGNDFAYVIVDAAKCSF
eukprot:6178072-Pleurochrysis_carterae.AAC.2